jgi:hypothetical protein
MNTFKRKSLHAAVLAGLGAIGAAGTASAVHLNDNGTGEVLIYPYFTVRSDGGAPATAPQYYDNLISVVNSTSSTKAVKVRILEGKRSAEVLDFNLFLSPFDVWTGAIVRTGAGTSDTSFEGAKLISTDNSCVVPTGLFTAAGTGAGALNAFKNFVYAPSNDGGGVTLDRTREGYVEIIEMGEVTNPTWTGWIKHGANGVPANCPALQGIDGLMSPGIRAPEGGLFGKMDIINPTSGSDFSYDAIAFDDWSDFEQYTRADSVLPALNGGGGALASPSVTRSDVFAGTGTLTSQWGTGFAAAADAFSAVLMRASVMNEFNVLAETDSGTDWVVTFPTKKLYVSVGAGAARRPFAANYNATNCANTSGSPDVFTFNVYNREEQVPGIATVVLPSPVPPGVVVTNTFCYESNVLAFNPGASLFGSTNAFTYDPVAGLVTAGNAPVAPTNRVGWMSINFNQAVQAMTPVSSILSSAAGVAPFAATYRGLPVMGFMAQDFVNRNAQAGRLATYGGSYVHKYRQNIQ